MKTINTAVNSRDSSPSWWGSCIENSCILLNETVQSLCEKVNNLTLGYLDADIVEECCQAFGCYPCQRMQSQTQAPQVWAIFDPLIS
jgi:hypothetical protein